MLISDGGSGTYLQANGLEAGGCPELMNIEQPEVVRQMAADFFAAGSNMVLTNSFGGNRFGLDRYGFGDRVREFNIAAAQIARSAAPDDGYVAGSIGPTGVFMQPVGDVTEDEMYDVMKEQSMALAEGGADAILIETMISSDEAVVGIKAAKENTDIPALAKLTQPCQSVDRPRQARTSAILGRSRRMTRHPIRPVAGVEPPCASGHTRNHLDREPGVQPLH